ncbi:hypothetical protein SAMN05421842_12815 [Clostridium uliginosum]|uniref:Uncharacterized protein n=1 Tax=Clostridium uliginosum TaxID=119641 RepID=A0A1I1QWI0_9CLOT|nr:hypothetical protein SAMN05421842_12815 [Clostridium uliginosum]
MTKEVSEINLEEIMLKFSTYHGLITHFCK